jgi:cation diffusion facilitator family transporter
MTNCCEDKSCEITAMRESHGRVLWIVLFINAVMFFVEGAAGLFAHSTSLLADALDMLGDALVYGFSLFVLARSARWQAGAALVKGSFMLAFGFGVMVEAAYKALHPAMPGVETMGIVGGLALAANLACFFLLYRHRSDNLNMSSTWLCSRNDLIANVGVLLAAGSSYLLVSRWPDIIVGAIIAGLFLESSLKVLRQSLRALRTPVSPPKTMQPAEIRFDWTTRDRKNAENGSE